MLTYYSATTSTSEQDRIRRSSDWGLNPNRFEATRPANERHPENRAIRQNPADRHRGWARRAEVNRLAKDLALALGCPVEVMYLQESREVLAVARPEPDREVRVTLPVSPIVIRLMDNPFAGVQYDLLKQLRRQMSREPDDRRQPPPSCLCRSSFP
jgi:hypothetical protein